MHTPTILTRRRDARARSVPAVALLLTLLALLAAAPAWAEEPGDSAELLPPAVEPAPEVPGAVVLPTEPPPPQPDPTVTIAVGGVCEPHIGIVYEIDVDAPPDGSVAYKAQWREPGGPVHTVDGKSGLISTGEGDFEVRGVLHDEGPGFHATEFVAVHVACDDPGWPEWPDDRPLPGTPNFTG